MDLVLTDTQTSLVRRYGTLDWASVFVFVLTEVSLIYNVVLISAIQQSGSVIHIYILFFEIFFSITVYHRILDILLHSI